MKNKLPSYTLKTALGMLWPSETEIVKKLFSGRRKITARDVLEIPAKKFRCSPFRELPGKIKCFIAFRLMPRSAREAWIDWLTSPERSGNEEGSSSDVKYGLKLCDMYENGEIK